MGLSFVLYGEDWVAELAPDASGPALAQLLR
jgi:hypothetical protein